MENKPAESPVEYSKEELQQIVLMCGSKGGFATYLRLDASKLEEVWKKNGLVVPTVLLRGSVDAEVMRVIARTGNLAKAAEYFGVSEATLKENLRSRTGEVMAQQLRVCDKVIVEDLNRYRSVRLAARMERISEGEVRDRAKELGVDLSKVVDASVTDFSNGFGRRAEIDFMLSCGDGEVLKDMNLGNPNAPFDVEHSVLGRVNVKASARYRFKGKSRKKEFPYYWKFSTRGLREADFLVCMCYSDDGKTLIKQVVIATQSIKDCKTFAMWGTRDGLPTGIIA